ncbi:hypothetical protein F442_20322 [Phytophthora nicotianae P10297]|uniref:RxLR effector protein n=5 Tax=Phytophthora nicotianae TaxID=4792 RepID=W2QTZ7_PHYN3|nr:hypothetical protein PPTG_05831 [Phytophthora nicotianae INRA-310]ETI32730.1 hypothetical protein F443_20512 [Phytophthora nicotianae P1569]ETK73073.1 hypothetical protein L915_19949 [Phytophthora nicotianae]ETO61472.1 hypothetical protein F444_20519 [Phytophthora nicotianae P1976]ETP30732.1 hypothetical protein F442_20322 [Phytophthora nicotianae P10297]KUF85599.1 hypothetical protein AM587_10009643 [Phytophthora nicotianae]
MNKRFLRSYDMDDLDKEGDEERMINPFRNAKPITPQKLDDLLVKEKIEFDEKNIETLFNQAKDGKIDGWLDDAALKILDPTQKQNIALMRENFNRLKGMGVTIQKVEKLKANKRYTALIYRYQNMLNLYISHLQAVARNAS